MFNEIFHQAKIFRFVHAAPADYRAQLNLCAIKLQNEVSQLVSHTIWIFTEKFLVAEKVATAKMAN